MNYYSDKEEKINWITHAIALGLSIAGAAFIYLSLATQHETEIAKWASATVYLISLVLLYTMSTSYHAIKNRKWKHVFRIADHIAIYVKIAGTYTPFLIMAFPSNNGIPWLVILWSLVVIGIFFKIFLVKKFNLLSTSLYLVMGWLAVFMIRQLYNSLPLPVLLCILAGGFFFTSGVLFYLTKKIPFSHSIWHVFVMTGSGWHYAGVYLLLLN